MNDLQQATEDVLIDNLPAELKRTMDDCLAKNMSVQMIRAAARIGMGKGNAASLVMLGIDAYLARKARNRKPGEL